MPGRCGAFAVPAPRPRAIFLDKRRSLRAFSLMWRFSRSRHCRFTRVGWWSVASVYASWRHRISRISVDMVASRTRHELLARADLLPPRFSLRAGATRACLNRFRRHPQLNRLVVSSPPPFSHCRIAFIRARDDAPRRLPTPDATLCLRSPSRLKQAGRDRLLR